MRRRPESAQAHFTLGYVSRYAGLLDESARECDTALAADPRNRGFRSCFFTFTQLKKYARARDYLRLDAGSNWSTSGEAGLLLREGRPVEAMAVRSRGPGLSALDVSPLILRSGAQSNRDRMAERVEAHFAAIRDAEPKFAGAGNLAAGGYPDGALRLLRKAVGGNYLCHQAMDNDPLFDSLRTAPEYAAIRAESIRKQKALLDSIAAPRG